MTDIVASLPSDSSPREDSNGIEQQVLPISTPERQFFRRRAKNAPATVAVPGSPKRSARELEEPDRVSKRRKVSSKESQEEYLDRRSVGALPIANPAKLLKYLRLPKILVVPRMQAYMELAQSKERRESAMKIKIAWLQLR